MSYLSMYRGDDRVLVITADEALTGSEIVFTAKRRKSDTDPVITKSTTAGSIVIGDPATTAEVTIDAADTEDLDPIALHWDIQVTDVMDKVHTVAAGRLAIVEDITRVEGS
jgi:hypothetical protein